MPLSIRLRTLGAIVELLLSTVATGRASTVGAPVLLLNLGMHPS